MFKGFMDYYEKNWKDNIFIDFKSLNNEELNDRTNNVCESFNSVLNKHVGISKPKLAVCVIKLKELELHYRQKTLKKINQGDTNVIVEEAKLDKLPFTHIYTALKDKEKEIQQSRYQLRSQNNEDKFIKNLYILSRECYLYLFPLQTDTEEKKEEGFFGFCTCFICLDNQIEISRANPQSSTSRK